MKEYYCTICGRKHNGKYSSKYCRKHQYQIKLYGHTLDNNPRTKFDSNEFRFIGDNTVEFDTYKAPTFNVDKTYIIDAEDYPIVSKRHWSTNAYGYARSGVGKKNTIFLHRLVTNAKQGQQVDHINLDIRDNRKNNLRICNNSLNSSNRRPYNKLLIKGVEEHNNGKFSAYFRVDNKQYHSPCYKTKEEAAFARFILEQKFRKEPLTQFTTEMINTLEESVKEKIINDIEQKFNSK